MHAKVLCQRRARFTGSSEKRKLSVCTGKTDTGSLQTIVSVSLQSCEEPQKGFRRRWIRFTFEKNADSWRKPGKIRALKVGLCNKEKLVTLENSVQVEPETDWRGLESKCRKLHQSQQGLSFRPMSPGKQAQNTLGLKSNKDMFLCIFTHSRLTAHRSILSLFKNCSPWQREDS